jgi:putative PEP-CTERM system histidine kinase
MNDILPVLSLWGHAATGFLFAAMGIWTIQNAGRPNRQQWLLVSAMALTACWGIAAVASGPLSALALLSETARNLAWIGFMFFLLRGGEGNEQPRTINLIYGVLVVVLLFQPMLDTFALSVPPHLAISKVALNSALLFRMIFAIGGLVLVHNLYTVSAPEARWGISLPTAALAAMWMYDLNLYTIAFLTHEISSELVACRGVVIALLAPVFVMAAKRNSNWRLRLSRTVAFRSASLLAIGGYLGAMVLAVTMIQLIGGTYTRLVQVTLIFGMSITALMILPSGKFRAWLNVVIAKNFFQHRYDYRSEWMRFADTIGYPAQEAAPFHERVVKSLADIFECPSGLLLLPDEQEKMVLQARWNWPTADIPVNCVTSHTLPFFESTSHILSMEEVRAGRDERCDPRAVPQWLFEETNAWAVVPLVHFGRLTGLAILGKPRIRRELDWEDLDMLRVVSRQLASYLAESASQQALAESQQFEQFNRRFAFVMHDIKNLVSQLSILSRNAEKHAGNPDFQEDMVATLRSSVNKMNDLLARLSQHNRAKHAEPVALDIGEALMKSVHAKRLIYPIDTDFVGGLLAVVDQARLETIINHLLQNAIEATEDGASIRMSCKQQGSEVAIRIADNGCGMTDAFIANNLFKPFESSKAGGFGIGAYEARSLAISMGGQLRVESRPGKGTTFTLTLPLFQVDGDHAEFEKAA